jgi:hypothetical protein
MDRLMTGSKVRDARDATIMRTADQSRLSGQQERMGDVAWRAMGQPTRSEGRLSRLKSGR